jgi:hypothetical protein
MLDGMSLRRPRPTPWGGLITQALRRSGLSARAAAERAGISEGRWRQVASGYESRGGTYTRVHGPASTVAKMAAAVGVTADQLTTAGRPDAAEVLRYQADTAETTMDNLIAIVDNLTEDDAVRLLAAIGRRLRGRPARLGDERRYGT